MNQHGSTDSFDQSEGLLEGTLEGVSSKNYKTVLQVSISLFFYYFEESYHRGAFFIFKKSQKP